MSLGHFIIRNMNETLFSLNLHLIQSKILPTKDFKLTVPDL